MRGYRYKYSLLDDARWQPLCIIGSKSFGVACDTPW